MNKIAALLIAAALFSPAFSEGVEASAKPEKPKVVATHKPKAHKLAKVASKTKTAKKPVIQSTVSVLHNPDYPWQTPA